MTSADAPLTAIAEVAFVDVIDANCLTTQSTNTRNIFTGVVFG